MITSSRCYNASISLQCAVPLIKLSYKMSIMSVYQTALNLGRKVLGAGLVVLPAYGCSDIGSGRIGQVFDDFNNDGRADMVSVYFDRSGVSETPKRSGHVAVISLGQENGTFSNPTEAFRFPLKPLNMSSGDIDGDGNNDVIFLTYDGPAEMTLGVPGSHDQYAAHGNGDGTFQNPRRVRRHPETPQ